MFIKAQLYMYYYIRYWIWISNIFNACLYSKSLGIVHTIEWRNFILMTLGMGSNVLIKFLCCIPYKIGGGEKLTYKIIFLHKQLKIDFNTKVFDLTLVINMMYVHYIIGKILYRIEKGWGGQAILYGYKIANLPKLMISSLTQVPGVGNCSLSIIHEWAYHIFMYL